MPRPKALVPALRYHISGQSICEIHGTTHCLETADSLESIARHTVLFREFQSNGLKFPAHITSEPLVGLAGCLLLIPQKVDQLQEQ